MDVLHIHIHTGEPGLADELRGIRAALRRIETKGNKIMADLTAIETAVAENASVDQSAITLLEGLSAQLQEAIESNDPAAVQALADDLKTSSARLAAAVTANTPVTETPEEPPVEA